MKQSLDRSLPRSSSSDRGAVLVWFAFLSVVFIGFGALVLDYGALLWERRQLQNAADSAALSVAGQCAFKTCTSGSVTTDAQSLVNANTADGLSTLSLCGNWAAGVSVCLPTPAGVPSGAKYVSALAQSSPSITYRLRPKIGGSSQSKVVKARATIIWGSYVQGFVVPITVSKCLIRNYLIGGDWVFPTTPIKLPLFDRSSSTCDLGGPLGNVSQAFDFINYNPPGTTGANCESVPIDLVNSDGVWVDANNGNNSKCYCELNSSGCTTSPLNSFIAPNQTSQGQRVFIPVFVAKTSGSNQQYKIDGLIAVRICAYSLAGKNINNCPESNPPTWDRGVCEHDGSNYFICGIFEKVDLRSGVIGGGGDYGSRVIKFVG